MRVPPRVFQVRLHRNLMRNLHYVHAHGALNDFGGILRLLLHSSIFSNNGASTKPGAVQNTVQACDVRLVIEPIAGVRPARRPEQADVVVVVQCSDCESGALGKFSNFQRHDSSQLGRDDGKQLSIYHAAIQRIAIKVNPNPIVIQRGVTLRRLPR
jgi:hypothetical protein